MPDACSTRARSSSRARARTLGAKPLAREVLVSATLVVTKNRVARQAGAADRLADVPLGAVALRGVDVAVAELDAPSRIAATPSSPVRP